MLQVWFDDSGKDGRSSNFVLAGYFGELSAWNDFADEWQALLEEAPRLEYLKAYEAFGDKEHFEPRDARLLKFAASIASHSGKGITFVIDNDAFDLIVAKAPSTPFRKPYTMAYFLALTTILPIVMEWFPSKEIDVIFDEGVIKYKQAETAYKYLFKLAPELSSVLAGPKPRFENDIKYKPLQASDLLAYCIRAHHDSDVRYDHVRNSRVFAALRAIPTILVRIEKKHLEYWRDRVESEIPHQAIPTGVRW